MTMMSLLVSIPGTWHWDASTGAEGYEFCWSYNDREFSRALCVDVGNQLSYLPSIEMDLLWAVESMPGAILFYQVCAYNSAGYDVDCASFQPIPPDWQCPTGACLP
jgi:hypothetical protein